MLLLACSTHDVGDLPKLTSGVWAWAWPRRAPPPPDVQTAGHRRCPPAVVALSVATSSGDEAILRNESTKAEESGRRSSRL
jgi:hypothetical protein